MKRVSFTLEADLDAALDRMALQQGTSKAELVRRFIRQGVMPLPPLEEDPLWKMVGSDHFEPADIDEVVYGLGPEPEA